MKNFIFLSLLAGLFTGNCLATEVLRCNESESGLRFRGKVAPEEHHPLVTKKITTTTEGAIEEGIIDEDAIFSDLGDIWEDFKSQNFEACFSPINVLRCEKDPKALYLMGVIYENKYYGFRGSLKRTTECYILSMAHTEEDSPLYRLALKALKRCQEKGLEKAKMPFSY